MIINISLYLCSEPKHTTMNKSFTGRLLDWPIEQEDGSELKLTIVYGYDPARPQYDPFEQPFEDETIIEDVYDENGKSVDFDEDEALEYVNAHGSFEPDPDPRYDD